MRRQADLPSVWEVPHPVRWGKISLIVSWLVLELDRTKLLDITLNISGTVSDLDVAVFMMSGEDFVLCGVGGMKLINLSP